MAFPNFSYCIICDGIRPELGGKLSILGFFGMCPDVEVNIQNPALPLALTIVAGWPPLRGAVDSQNVHSVQVIRPDHVPIQLPTLPLNVAPGKPGILGTGVVIQPPYPAGIYTIRISVNNSFKLDTTFQVRIPDTSPYQGMPTLSSGGLVH